MINDNNNKKKKLDGNRLVDNFDQKINSSFEPTISHTV